jgi:hypothetical protein
LRSLLEEIAETLAGVGEDRQIRTAVIAVELDAGQVVVTCTDDRRWVGQAFLRQAIDAVQHAREREQEGQ